MQWLLGHYHNNNSSNSTTAVVFGASSEIHPAVTVHADNPYSHRYNDRFNVAVSSATTDFAEKQLDQLKKQMRQKHGGDNGGWMIVTIFLGENDLCDRLESCGTAEERQVVLDTFERNMDALLNELIKWRRKLYIHLVELSWMSSVARQQSWRCRAEETALKVCQCMHHGGNVTVTAKLDLTTNGMNAILEQTAAKYDRIRPDVGWCQRPSNVRPRAGTGRYVFEQIGLLPPVRQDASFTGQCALERHVTAVNADVHE